MPDYDVFIEADVFVLDKTRTVRVPCDGNPYTEVDESAAITAAAKTAAKRGRYVALPAGVEVPKDVTFDRVPILSDPPAA